MLKLFIFRQLNVEQNLIRQKMIATPQLSNCFAKHSKRSVAAAQLFRLLVRPLVPFKSSLTSEGFSALPSLIQVSSRGLSGD